MAYSEQQIGRIALAMDQALRANRLNPWEKRFLNDNRNRIRRHGRHVRFSERQIQVLERLIDLDDETNAPPVSSGVEAGERQVAAILRTIANRRKGLGLPAFSVPWAAILVSVVLVGVLGMQLGPPMVGCTIKGNISRTGERIYHVPGQRRYNATVVNLLAGERWFCSPEEARRAGWRRTRV
jgi:hypothetical protein